MWNYQTSPLFSAAERAALDVAVAAGCVPNAVTDEMFMELRKHWSDEQVVEIVGVIAMFGFLNRWNDTFATPLEDEPLEFGEKHLAAHGWDAGKHLRDRTARVESDCDLAMLAGDFYCDAHPFVIASREM